MALKQKHLIDTKGCSEGALKHVLDIANDLEKEGNQIVAIVPMNSNTYYIVDNQTVPIQKWYAVYREKPQEKENGFI